MQIVILNSQISDYKFIHSTITERKLLEDYTKPFSSTTTIQLFWINGRAEEKDYRINAKFLMRANIMNILYYMHNII